MTQRRWITPMLVAVLLCAGLQPFARTYFYFDDAVMSLNRAHLLFTGTPLHEFIAEQSAAWMRSTGRFFPAMAAIQGSLWHWVFHSLPLYRAIQLLFVLANILMFSQLLRGLGRSREQILLFVLVLLPLFQLRNTHDPIASYGGIQQILLGFGLSICLLFRRHERTGSPAALAGLASLFAVALLYYEIALVFIPLLLIVAEKDIRQTLRSRAFLGCLVLAVIYLAGVAWLRANSSVSYPGVQLSLGWKLLRAFAWQVSASFPLIHALFGRSGFYDLESLARPPFLSWTSLLLFILFSTALLLQLRRTGHVRDPRLERLGWALVLLPSAMIALSAKYQDELSRPGIGYLPVYLSYFGAATLLSSWLPRLAHGGAKWKSAAVVLLGGFAFSVTHAGNLAGVDQLNSRFRTGRVAFEESLGRGLGQALKGVSELVTFSGEPWLREDFLWMLTGRKIRVMPLGHVTGSAFPLSTRLIQVLPHGTSYGLICLGGDLVRGPQDELQLGSVALFLHATESVENLILTDGAHHIALAPLLKARNGIFRGDLTSPKLNWRTARLVSR